MRAGGSMRLGLVLLAALLLPAGVGADELGGTAREARKAAARARDAGKTKEAVGHLLVGLGEHPHAAELLLELVETTKDDPSARTLWSHALIAALADEKGRFKLPKGADALIDKKKDPLLGEVATARAKAVAGLAKSAGRAKGPGSYALALAYTDLARALTSDAPRLWKAHAAALSKAISKVRPKVKAVLAALKKSAGGLGGPDPSGAKLELGRAIRGMASQAKAKAAGAKEGSGTALDSLADSIIRDALTALEAEQMEPLTIKQLEAMDNDQIAEFNRKHANIRRPGRAISETGKYVITCACGHGTLLATAEMAEPTHDRLARWFGMDPFTRKKAQGEIRVFPTFADLESESTPYFWANGFQRGAVTVVRFAAERKIELARLLSHELMHRFDQLLYPGMPGWLAEGRGVYAGGAFASSMAGDFVDNYIDGGRVNDAGSRLYSDRYWLEKFVKGDWDDYRDNYTAGHALWSFLYLWEMGGKKLFRPKLKAYLQAVGTGSKKPIELFAAHFADGADGRPSDMDEFAKSFGDFLMGWRAEKPPAWWSKFTFYVGDDSRSPFVEDAKTWNLERHREEPVFGQDHPARAAVVLAESGQVKAAIGLLEWSLAVDDFEAERGELLAELLEKEGRKEAAAAMRLRVGRSDLPFLSAKHPVHAYAGVLAKAAETYAGKDMRYAAHIIRNRHETLVDRIGGGGVREGAKKAAPTSDHFPLCGPLLHHVYKAWREESLSDGYDKWREKDAWRLTAEGDLIVGKASVGTTGSSGIAGSPWMFVRSDRRMHGAYSLSGRIELLSPHCDGAIVLGWSRSDRNVRVKFEAGEWGQEDRAMAPDERLREVSLHVTGLRYRDRVLTGAETFATTRFKDHNEFGYRIDVDGEVMDVFINGRRIATFAEGSGQPIAGFTGFAVRHGAIRVEKPRVRFHHGGDHASCPHGFPFAHDPAAPTRDIDTWIIGRRLLGAPRSERGTLVLWYPLPFIEDPADMDEKVDDARMHMNATEGACRRVGCNPRYVVYLPRKWPEKARAKLIALAKETFGDDVTLRDHFEGMGAAANVDPDVYGYSPYVLYQDPTGITRHMNQGSADSDDEGFVRWMRIYRGW